MSDQDRTPDPIDQAYVSAEAALADDAARAARRARVLAMVAQEAPVPAATARPRALRRAGWGWGGFATAASVAGLGVFLALHTDRLPTGLPTPPAIAPAPAASISPQAAENGNAPAEVAAPRMVSSSPQAAAPTAVIPAPGLDIPPPPAAPALRALAAPAPAPPPPPAAFAPPPQAAELGGQGSRATLTLLDGQRLAGDLATSAPVAGGGRGGAVAGRGGALAVSPSAALSAPPVALSSSVEAISGVNVTATGTNIAGVKPVGSPVQRVTREDLLRTGATDIRSALQTLPLAQAGGGGFADYEAPQRLRAAAAAGQTAEVETLLSQFAAIDAPDNDGNTALMLSIKSNHPATVALLRRRGASLDLANKAGQRAADLAKAVNSVEMNQALGLAP